MKATEQLMSEHRQIERMLSVLEAVSSRAQAGGALDPKDLEGIVGFLRGFADRCHHAKEEDLLFPAMEAAGIPREGGPIGVMLAEHVEGRATIGRLSAAIDDYKTGRTGASAQIASAARDYVGLLSMHIRKEDQILYPMADGRLSPDQDAELVEAFEAVERDRLGPGEHAAFGALLDRLEKTYTGK